MGYTIEGLESSRNNGFRPKKILGLMLKEFLNLKDNMKILDLGCGTGFFTRIIGEQCKADITGMDINETLLEGAKEITKKQGLNIKYEIGDITNINYEDETFDIVMCDIMLECFKDIYVPLNEMKRVCKKGGLIVSIEPFYQSGFEYFPELNNKDRDLILKFSRVDRSFGVGPSVPSHFNNIGLKDIDLISWFWGGIRSRDLEFKTIDEKLKGMEENLEHIKSGLLNKCISLSPEEKEGIVGIYEKRLNTFRDNPELIKKDMSVRGVPVFIVKGEKL